MVGRQVTYGSGRIADARGAVLVVVVLMSIAMFALAHGLLVSARSAYATSRARVGVAEVQAAADGVVEGELQSGAGTWMDSIAVGGRRTVISDPPEAPRTTATWRRLQAEAWLIEASATSLPDIDIGSRRLAWVYDPVARVDALPGVVSIGLGAPVVVEGALVADTGSGLGIVGEAALGRLDLDRLLDESAPVGPLGTPEPVEAGGVCETSEPWNWGDPNRPFRPCGDYTVVKASSGSMTVDGGVGQGILVVDGDLVLRSGASFFGLVVASGRVDVTDGSTVEGRVLAFGGIRIEAGAIVVGSREWAVRVLTDARPTLGRAIPLHPAVRLGPD